MRIQLRCAAAVVGLLVIAGGLAPAARALPPPEPVRGKATPEPTAPPTGIAVLPIGSPLLFVLDEGFSSNKSRKGDIVHMHLRDALIVNGVTLAPAGSPATLTIVNTHRAGSGDEDGSVAINIQPLALPGHGTLPVRAIHEYLTIEHTAGQLATRDATDQVTDIFIPYALIYNAFRKGHEYVLGPGTVLRALTNATVDASNPNAIAIVNPAPLVINEDAPHSDYTPAPFYTPAPIAPRRTPSPKPTNPPTPTPAPTGTT